MHDLAKRLKYIYSFLKRGLVHLNLQILYQCNFSCNICDFWKAPYKDMPMLSATQAAVVSEKLRSLGPQIISIGGGEPLLHPELPEIVRVLSRHHFPVMICNGWYMTPERARELFQAGLYEISISLDYADPEKHDRQRGVVGAHDRALRALETLFRNRVFPHQRVHMITVVMDDNLPDIEPLIRMAQSIGVTYLVTLYSHGRGNKASRSSQQEVRDLLLDLKRRYPDFVALRGYLDRFTEAARNDNGVMPCYAGKNLFNIDCQGNVTRCIDRLDQVAGNILSDELGDIRQALRKQYEAKDCGACWTSCRGNIETLMYGPRRVASLCDSYQVTRRVPLAQ